MAELELIDIAKVYPHPDNPRVALREDVIGALAANMGDEYPKKHAVHVRRTEDGYQLLSGHHRRESAIRKGFTHVWAWVDDMDDAAAFMELVTSNNQGELSPLEIGIHALKAVPKGSGGRGKKGGLSEYAEKVGKTQGYVSQVRQAAEVLAVAKPITQVMGFLDKAKHLCALHALPQSCWSSACQWLATAEVSAADVEARVKKALKFRKDFTVPELWKVYLSLDECTVAVLEGTTGQSFKRLLDLAVSVHDSLPEDLAGRWRTWLTYDNASWDIQAVQAKRIELEQIAWDRENSPSTDEARLILADPPWQYDFAETDSRQVENQYPTATVEEICSHINAPWAPRIANDCVLYLWATAPKLEEALAVMRAWGFTYKTHAVWDKEKIGMGYWFRGQHELLLVGTRGDCSPPDAALRVASVFREARGEHSVKPECVYQAIEAMFPEIPDNARCEFYQRTPRDGWKGVGNEA